jgi:diamine N-acetyltransferase
MVTDHSPIDIRRATTEDSGLLAELGERTFRDTFGSANTPEDMARYLSGSFSPAIQAAELDDPSNAFVLAEVESEPVGYARLREGPVPLTVPGSRPLEIVRFYAVRPWIGRGVGSMLMQACLDLAGQKGHDTLWLDVWEQNPRAIAFYKKWGFEIVGNQPFRLGDDLQNDLLMARSIEPVPG